MGTFNLKQKGTSQKVSNFSDALNSTISPTPIIDPAVAFRTTLEYDPKTSNALREQSRPFQREAYVS